MSRFIERIGTTSWAFSSQGQIIISPSWVSSLPVSLTLSLSPPPSFPSGSSRQAMWTSVWFPRERGTSTSRRWPRLATSWPCGAMTLTSTSWMAAGPSSGMGTTRPRGRCSPTSGRVTWRTWPPLGPRWSLCGYRYARQAVLKGWIDFNLYSVLVNVSRHKLLQALREKR